MSTNDVLRPGSAAERANCQYELGLVRWRQSGSLTSFEWLSQ